MRTGPAALTVGALLAAPLPGASPQEAPTFPSEVEIVRIDAVVVDRDGRPVPGLTSDGFTIEEDGRLREIVSFEPIVVHRAPRDAVAAPPTSATPAGPAPDSSPHAAAPEEGRVVLLFFDDVNVTPASLAWVRPGLAAFLSRGLQPGDTVAIATTTRGLWWTASTPWEHGRLGEVVGTLKGYLFDSRPPGLEWNAMRECEHGAGDCRPGTRQVYETAVLRASHTLEALERTLEALADVPGRKSVIVYTEGFIHSSRLRELDQRVVDRARRANVVVSVANTQGLRTGLANVADMPPLFRSKIPGGVGALRFPRSPVGGPTTLLDGDTAGSTDIALATGGLAEARSDAVGPIERALEESSAYYLIGFQPAAGPPGERKLEVKVTGKGRTVRARSRYVLGGTAEDTGAPPGERAMRSMADATELPIRVSVSPGDAPSGAGVPVRLRLVIAPLAGPPRERRLKMGIQMRRADGRESAQDAADLTVPPSREPLAITRELQLAPGLWPPPDLTPGDEKRHEGHRGGHPMTQTDTWRRLVPLATTSRGRTRSGRTAIPRSG
jgi:VWFA-related protein